MASCLLRKLANPQFLRYVSPKAASFSVVQRQNKKLHTSSSAWQKYFTEKHEWIDVPEGSTQGTVGITDYAQDKLGDVVYVQLPEVGQTLEADSEAGVLESVKAASDIYSPVSGDVIEVNDAAAETPGTINQSPYDNGWLFKLNLSSPNELESLMDEAGYEEFLKTEE